MTDPLAAFLTALQSDTALKARFHDALPETADNVPARVKAFAAAEGYAVSDDDLAALDTALAQRRQPEDGARVLNDHEVDAVSGGILGPVAVLFDRLQHSINGGSDVIHQARAAKSEERRNFLDASKRQFWLGF